MLKIKSFLISKKCIKCHKEFLIYSLRKICPQNYICNHCTTCQDYTTKNTNKIGKETNISFSLEFETNRKNLDLFILYKYDFLACNDSTIEGIEFKSPIMYNKKTLYKICKKLDKFKDYVDNKCGTHLHVSTPYKSKIQQFERYIFSPILQEMKNDIERTEKFWGRKFNQYCTDSIGDSRYNSFNTRSSVDTLEFRLLQFKNSEQYYNACNFCIDITKYINNHIKKVDFNQNDAEEIGQVIMQKYKEAAANV